ncbi:hypothetical protein [Gallaecimonas mangrovi]|uniref:hypothetical protein n=1 Tax=Gallaecimonas mangrovi TaxID=2291597 RepID=UPI000E1FCC83|nr:hypothetical protein [Gallaecimonas mangrovi]
MKPVLIFTAVLLTACSQTSTPPPEPAPKVAAAKPLAPVISDCQKASRSEVTLGPFSVSLGQQVAVQGEDLYIRFEDISVDPRCGPGSQCQGQLKVSVSKGGLAPDVFLLYSDDVNPVYFQGYSLQLTQLVPAFDSRQPYRSLYCADMDIEKLKP